MLAFRPRGSGRSALVCRLFRGGSGLLAQLLGIAGAPDGTTVAPQGACARSFDRPESSIGGNMKNKFIQAAAVSALAVFVSAAPAFANDTWITTKAKIALL